MTPAPAANNNGNTLKKIHTLPALVPSQRGGSLEPPKSPISPISPTLSLRDAQADASQFPLSNIDDPSDIAQELSNLQNLRRMSMDVGNNSDPDLLPFSGMSVMVMPSIAPKGEDDEGDPSRLLWVPAKVHPELAPEQFRNFLEGRVKSMRRRSGSSQLSVDALSRSDSGSGLHRRPSMLSKQIDGGSAGGEGYGDGAERRLARTGSLRDSSTPELSLDDLVRDPSRVVQQLAQEAQRPETEG
ncbi:MAG: hypothetical protein OK454_09465, partial [Thaumarchaeota archaeon]|nr:hypothetical protein [Nitrososphaerota archaeon]